MLKKLLYGRSGSIANAAMVIAITSLASRVLGIFRDRVLAGEFGAGAALDIYYSAFRIPDLIYNLIILGAVSAGFIPIFTSLMKEEVKNEFGETVEVDNSVAWKLTNNIINIFSFFVLIISVICFIFAKDLVHLISPGFTPMQVGIATNMTRIMFLSPIFLGLSGIVGAVLQSFKRFFIFSLSPIMYNVGIIIGAVYLTKWFDIYGLAWGVALGALLHLLIQLPALFDLGFKYQRLWDWKDQNVRAIGKMMLPRILGLATTQFNLIVITFFGSMIATGSIAIFNLANNLQGLPVGLIGVSFAIAAFPTLSNYYNKKDLFKFNSTFNDSFRLILFAIIPLSVLFLLLRTEIVRIILGAGKFAGSDIQTTANAFGWFILSLFAQALIPLFARAFFARHNTMWPLLAGIVGAIGTVFFAWWLTPKFGVMGLSLAFSIGAILDFVVLFITLKRAIGDFEIPVLLTSLMKIVGSSVLMGAVIWGLKTWFFKTTLHAALSSLLFDVFMITIVSGVVFILANLIMKSKEMNYIKGMLKRKWYSRRSSKAR